MTEPRPDTPEAVDDIAGDLWYEREGWNVVGLDDLIAAVDDLLDTFDTPTEQYVHKAWPVVKRLRDARDRLGASPMTCAYCTGDETGLRPEFVIRETFELHMRTLHFGLWYEPRWGLRDARSIDDIMLNAIRYRQTLDGVSDAMRKADIEWLLSRAGTALPDGGGEGDE